MSTDQPNRTISGLAPRSQAPASLLVKGNRPAAPPSAPVDETPAALTAPQAKPGDPNGRRRPNEPATARKQPAARRVSTADKVQITADVPDEVRGRARAAYRAAAYFESVATFSQFVENAVLAEVRRIEAAYNEGQEFEPMTENLPSGRPAGG